MRTADDPAEALQRRMYQQHRPGGDAECPKFAGEAGAGPWLVIPRDQIKSVLDSADVVIWTTESPDEQKALLADPDVAGSQATAQNRHVFTTKDQAGAIAFSSPLSYPLVADQLPPLIGKILG